MKEVGVGGIRGPQEPDSRCTVLKRRDVEETFEVELSLKCLEFRSTLLLNCKSDKDIHIY